MEEAAGGAEESAGAGGVRAGDLERAWAPPPTPSIIRVTDPRPPTRPEGCPQSPVVVGACAWRGCSRRCRPARCAPRSGRRGLADGAAHLGEEEHASGAEDGPGQRALHTSPPARPRRARRLVPCDHSITTCRTVGVAAAGPGGAAEDGGHEQRRGHGSRAFIARSMIVGPEVASNGSPSSAGVHPRRGPRSRPGRLPEDRLRLLARLAVQRRPLDGYASRGPPCPPFYHGVVVVGVTLEVHRPRRKWCGTWRSASRPQRRACPGG